MKIDFTVAIPTYNGAERLPLVLAKLRSQITPDSLTWEILIIDNNSHDQTQDLVEKYQREWPTTVPLRYYFEPRQGVAFARQRAIAEAQGQWVGFIDDDNLPAVNWVAEAYQFGCSHPQAGAYGGIIEPQGDVVLLQDKRIQNFLAIRRYSQTPQLFQPEKLRLPPGAGLVVRRDAWLQSVPAQLLAIHRAGDDYEASLHLHKAGWEIWHNPAMTLQHCIPDWRLQRSYLMPLARRYGLWTCELVVILAPPSQIPIVLLKSFLGSARRLVAHVVRHRGHLLEDLGTACETAFLVGNLMSPFNFLKTRCLHLCFGWKSRYSHPK